MLQRLFNALLAIAILLAAARARGDDAKVELTLDLRTCIDGKATLVKGGACWMLDPINKKSHYEVLVCFGLALDAGMVFAGVEGNVLACGTARIPIEAGSDPAKRRSAVESAIRARLADPAFKKRVLDSLNARGDIKSKPVQEATGDTATSIKKAIENSKAK
jgi:hypothetical protein